MIQIFSWVTVKTVQFLDMRFYKPILLEVCVCVSMTVVPIFSGRSADHSALGQAQTVLVSFNEEGGTLAIFVLA